MNVNKMEAKSDFLMSVKRKEWIYLLRQVLVCSGVWSFGFMVGQLLGAPTVYVPQLRSASVALSDEMASWLYSAFGIAAVPWLILLPISIRMYGPRIPFILASINMLITYVIFFFSTTPLQLLISEIVFGLCYASALTIGIVIVSEYSSPEYRGIFLTMKAASLVWGVWSANAIGTFFHWKCIAYPGFLCSAFSFTFVFCPDSPHWLASRGRFDECRKAYYWLRGHNANSEQEVEKLIESQVRAQKNSILNDDWSSFSNALETVQCREFYAPLLLSTLLVIQCNFSGKIVCTVYVIDILKKMTGDESTAYMAMLILDGVTVFAMYFGCFLSKILKRRTLYITSSFIAVAFLLIISLYLYLIKLAVLKESNLISIVLLTCFSIAVAGGPLILTNSIYAEIIPLRFKCVIILIVGLIFYVSLTVLLKTAPYIFMKLGLHGAFLFFGITAGTCTLLLCMYLPETKDKTLQEIEENFKDDQRISDTERLK